MRGDQRVRRKRFAGKVKQLQRCPDRLFQLRLAAKLGVPDADTIANALSPSQLLEWQALAVIDGWDHGYRQTAEILAAIQNAVSEMKINTSADPRRQLNATTWKSGWDIICDYFSFGVSKPKRRKLLSVKQAQEELARR